MNIEKEIFKRMKLNVETLIPYGFTSSENVYKYSKTFMDSFQVNIIIDTKGNVTGKIVDLSVDEEYINFRIESQNGKFVHRVREEYKSILEDIKDHCFEKRYFITEQANRIAEKIIEKYHNEPEFPWKKSPGNGIFRNPNDKKWYGLIMNIDKSKIDKKCTGEIEVINVKLDVEIIPKLLKKKGFYPAYHMNKKNWITIILDDTLTDDEIMRYIHMSHSYTDK